MGQFRFKNIKSGAGDKSAGVTRVTPSSPRKYTTYFFSGVKYTTYISLQKEYKSYLKLWPALALSAAHLTYWPN